MIIRYVPTQKGWSVRNGGIRIAEITKRGRAYRVKYSRGIGEVELLVVGHFVGELNQPAC